MRRRLSVAVCLTSDSEIYFPTTCNTDFDDAPSLEICTGTGCEIIHDPRTRAMTALPFPPTRQRALALFPSDLTIVTVTRPPPILLL